MMPLLGILVIAFLVGMAQTAGARAMTAVLDSHIDAHTAAGVQTALATTDPEKSKPSTLMSYAAALQPQFPLAASAVRDRATMITLQKAGVH